MTILDRLFFRNYIKNYIIVFSCMLTLYVVLDLFTNLNDFAVNRNGVVSLFRHVAGYYAVQITIIFDKLAPIITVLAGLFTVVWMQKSNELLPQLSAGVSTYRVIRPIVFGCLCTLALSTLNTEMIIPRLADQLTISRDDPERVKPVQVRGAFDPMTRDHFIGGGDQSRKCARPGDNVELRSGFFSRVLQCQHIRGQPSRDAGYPLASQRQHQSQLLPCQGQSADVQERTRRCAACGNRFQHR